MIGVLTIAMINLWTTMGAGYTINYFDCINPSAITTYKHTTACEHQREMDIRPETYTILQNKSTQRIIMCCLTKFHGALLWGL